MRVNPWIRRAALVAALLTCIPLLALSELRLQRKRIAERHAPGERYYLPPARVLRGLAFGYNELGADMVWVRTIAYFTDRLFSDRDLSHLRRYVETIVAFDDAFYELYRFGASMFMSRGERQTNDDVWAAIHLLKRGHRRFPNRWEIPFGIGSNYMFELRSRSKAQRDRWRREGAHWINRASLLGPRISWLPTLAAKVFTEQGQRDLAIRHLQELYLTTQDPAMKEHIAAKLAEMKATRVAGELEAQAEAFARWREQSPLGFVPADLLVQIGLKPLPPFSLAPAAELPQPEQAIRPGKPVPGQ